MAQFNLSKLVGHRVMVSGTDNNGVSNQAVLDSQQWDEVNSTSAYDQAKDAFDRAVEEFFAPITEASEKLNKALNTPRDADSYVVVSEPVEGQQAKPGTIIKLTHDSVVLRLLERGDHDRVVWVGDNLEILEVDDALPFEEPSVSDVAGSGTPESGETNEG